jgi:hypothetical protein
MKALISREDSAHISGVRSRARQLIRVAVFYFWEEREFRKEDPRRPTSEKASTEESYSKLVYDHAVPASIVADLVLEQADDAAVVKAILEQLNFPCFIHQEEDKLLNQRKLKSRMPAAWDGRDPLARYREVGIKIPGYLD